MATYDEFLNAARNANLYDQFSAYDLQLAQANPDIGFGLLQAKNDWRQSADEAGRSAANQRAEALRSNAYNTAGITSYTGGSWGMEYNPIYNGNPTGSMVPQTSGNTGTASSFTPSTATPQVNSNWDAANLPAHPTFTPSYVEPFDTSAYGSAPTYTSQYTPQINDALQASAIISPSHISPSSPATTTAYRTR